jgi:hypothetical protein
MRDSCPQDDHSPRQFRMTHHRHARRRSVAGIILCIAAACTDPNVIEYRGTAMNEARPDSAGEVVLTLWERSDTSFSGYVRIAEPVGFRAPVYAWHEGSAFMAVAVPDSGGDTLRFSSRTTEDSIGGVFTIRGASGAKGGIWRAHRTRGPQVSTATLTSKPAANFHLGGILAALAVIALLVAAARWVHRTPLPDRGSIPEAHSRFSELSGIGGWLALFVIGQILSPITLLLQSGELFSGVQASVTLEPIAPLILPVVIVESFVHLARFVLPIVGVVLIVKRNRLAPRYWFIYLVGLAVFCGIDMLVAGIMGSQLERVIGVGFDSGDSGTTDNLRLMLWSAVWATYWAQSLRVRATFGADAFDRPLVGKPVARAAPPVPAPVPSDAS